MTDNYSVASLNFIDLRLNNGPAVNEIEFNRWLLSTVKDSILYTPFHTQRLAEFSSRIIAFGGHSLRQGPYALIARQIAIARSVSSQIAPKGLIYYRHSRLCSAPLLIKSGRPDVHVAATRMHPPNSDTHVTRGLAGIKSRVIEAADLVIRDRLLKVADWVDCVTPSQQAAISNRAKRPVNVVMNGVNVEHFKPLPSTRRREVRAAMGIPETAIVVGYCGGFPEQRGAREVLSVVRANANIHGVVVGKLVEKLRPQFMHERMHLLGEIAYEKVAEVVGIFDVAVAFDAEERVEIIGNSNQKVRQALACGAWVITQQSDLPLDENPFLGVNVSKRDGAALVAIIERSAEFIANAQARATYAANNLSSAAIFGQRHQAIMSGI